MEVGDPLDGGEAASRWLKAAGETELAGGVVVLNRVLQAHRIATADPRAHGIGRHDALVARVGYGGGEQVADGLWTDARELTAPVPRRRRSRVPAAQARLSRVPAAQARLAALLTGHQVALGCEELALRARLDLDEGRAREAALQARIALDAALAELGGDPSVPALRERLQELRELQPAVAAAAEHAVGGTLPAPDREAVASALARLEAALRARAAALAQ